jgi:hypothetical protein
VPRAMETRPSSANDVTGPGTGPGLVGDNGVRTGAADLCLWECVAASKSVCEREMERVLVDVCMYEREGGRERECVCVCVFVFVFMCLCVSVCVRWHVCVFVCLSVYVCSCT